MQQRRLGPQLDNDERAQQHDARDERADDLGPEKAALGTLGGGEQDRHQSEGERELTGDVQLAPLRRSGIGGQLGHHDRYHGRGDHHQVRCPPTPLPASQPPSSGEIAAPTPATTWPIHSTWTVPAK